MAVVPLFRAGTGVQTKSDPVRLKMNQETGTKAFAKAVNVKVEPDGRATTVTGWAIQDTGNFHSYFEDDHLVVKDSYICRIGIDFSTTQIVQLASSNRVSYARLGPRTYWCNGVEKGYIEGTTNYDWDLGTTANPDEETTFSAPPIGHFVAVLDRHIWVADDTGLYPSEPEEVDVFNLALGIPFETRITMLATVRDGLWVSDQRGIYFVGGLDPHEQTLVRVASYPVIEGAFAYVDAERLQMEGLGGAGRVVMFLTPKGLCVGGPQGFFLNRTLASIETHKTTNPFTASRGAAAAMGDYFVATLEP